MRKFNPLEIESMLTKYPQKNRFHKKGYGIVVAVTLIILMTVVLIYSWRFKL